LFDNPLQEKTAAISISTWSRIIAVWLATEIEKVYLVRQFNNLCEMTFFLSFHWEAFLRVQSSTRQRSLIDLSCFCFALPDPNKAKLHSPINSHHNFCNPILQLAGKAHKLSP